MPRIKRVTRPGALIHIIVRFLNHEPLLESPASRAEYLRRFGQTFGQSDWATLCYALMDTHAHFGAIAGRDVFGDLSRRLHVGFAEWCNPRLQRLGPVVADRPKTFELRPTAALGLISYIHNNPVDAGLADTAAQSARSSHNAYLGQRVPESWLNVDLGRQLAGIDGSAAGLAEFDDFVNCATGHPRYEIDKAVLSRHASELRPTLSNARIGTPLLDDDGQLASFAIFHPSDDRFVPVDPGYVVLVVAAECSLTVPALQSVSRHRPLVAARRIAVICGRRFLGLPLIRIAAALNITAEGARYLERTATKDDTTEARRVAGCVLANLT